MNKKEQKKFIKNLNEIINQEKFKWIIINGIKTDYIISSYGYVMNMNKNVHAEPKILEPWVHKDHAYISLSVNGKRYKYQLHRLLAIYFIPNPENKPIVHHIDKNPVNNKLYNLMWVTEKEHKFYHEDEMKLNRPDPSYGSDCNLSVYNDEQIKSVCKLLEENKLTIKEINNITNVGKDTIRKILDKKQWMIISKDFNIDNYTLRKSTVKYADKSIHKVCELLEKGESERVISQITNVSINTIHRIKNKKSWIKISHLYNF